jgi:maltose O-acetyltransferase
VTLNPVRWPRGVPSDAAPAADLRQRHGRLRGYLDLFRRSLHVRYALANLICRLFPDFASGVIRGRVYRWAGFAIGDGAFLMGNLTLKGASRGFYDNLVVGEGATIADHVTINLDAKVTIGKNVGIAPHVLIYTGSHEIGPGSMRIGAFTGLPVTIEDGAWIRVGAVIVPGVTIGHGAIVAAGAVVLKDVPPDTYVEGNPAQVVRKLPWGYR